MEIFVFVLIGVLAGISAGLFGIGGGLITVPAMIFILPLYSDINAQLFHVAIATSLAAIIPTAIMSSYAHYKKGAIQWQIVSRLSIGLAIGAFIGVLLALDISSFILKTAFAIFLSLVAVGLFKESLSARAREFNSRLVNPFAGLLIGGISSIMGVGGGTMTVPYLLRAGLKIHQAIACSAVLGLPIAISATIAFYLARFTEHELAGGYIYWPALIGITLAAVFFAPIGAKLAHRLPVALLKKLFSFLLIIVAMRIMFS